MKLLAVITLFCALGALPAHGAAQRPPVEPLLACAVFSHQGDLAEVTIHRNMLNLQVIRVDRTGQSSQVALHADEHDCRVFFANDGSILAVVGRIGQHRVRVRIWNVESGGWQARFDVGPRPGLEGELDVAGFWKGGLDLLVAAWRGKYASTEASAMLVGPSGATVLGPVALTGPGWIDAKHNRLWIISDSNVKGCLVKAVQLIGHASLARRTDPPKVQCACFYGGLHEFLDGRFVVGTNDTGNGGTWVRSCQIHGGEPDKLLLPSPPKQLLDAWVDSGPAELAVSPHGDYFGVNVQITRWSHFDTQRAEWSELHLFQTFPLREIGKIGPGKRCRALIGFAVGDADGKPHIAANWCGKWTVETVSITEPVSHHHGLNLAKAEISAK